MCPLADTSKGFSLTNQLHAHVAILPLRQELTFYMTANSIKSHGTQSESLSKIFLTFLEFNHSAYHIG